MRHKLMVGIATTGLCLTPVTAEAAQERPSAPAPQASQSKAGGDVHSKGCNGLCFLLKNRATGKCLKGGTTGTRLTMVKCSRKSKLQWWGDRGGAGQKLVNTNSPGEQGRCLGYGKKEKSFPSVKFCSSKYTGIKGIFSDGKSTTIWASGNKGCNVKASAKGNVVCTPGAPPPTKREKWKVYY